MPNKITHTQVYVLDQHEALDFYVGKLGFELNTDADLGFMRWLTVNFPGQPDHQLLLEKPGRLPGQLVGKTPYQQTVQIMARPELIGSVRPINITRTGTNTLFGEIADQRTSSVFATAGA